MNVRECKERLAGAAPGELADLIRELESDGRAGVRDAVHGAQRRLARLSAERDRLDRLAELEETLHAEGYCLVAGVDEVGRGALAGPLTAGAVVLAPGTRIDGLDDSKRLTPQRRAQIAGEIRSRAAACSVAHVEASVVDALGMTAALRQVMRAALDGLGVIPDHVVLDGHPLRLGPPETAVVGGDARVAAIAAASVIAKVERDSLMIDLDARFPGYDFALNKGYGTAEHIQAVSALGTCEAHRRSFAPCAPTMRLFP